MCTDVSVQNSVSSENDDNCHQKNLDELLNQVASEYSLDESVNKVNHTSGYNLRLRDVKKFDSEDVDEEVDNEKLNNKSDEIDLEDDDKEVYSNSDNIDLEFDEKEGNSKSDSEYSEQDNSESSESEGDDYDPSDSDCDEENKKIITVLPNSKDVLFTSNNNNNETPQIIALPNSIMKLDDGDVLFKSHGNNNPITACDARRVAKYTDSGWLEASCVEHGIIEYLNSLSIDKSECIHVFSVHVYQKIEDKFKKFKNVETDQHKKLLKMFNKNFTFRNIQNVYKKEYIYFIICKDKHFFLVCMKGLNRFLENDCSEDDGSRHRPYLLFMDSLGSSHTKGKITVAKSIYNYLNYAMEKEEFEIKENSEKILKFNERLMPIVHCNVRICSSVYN